MDGMGGATNLVIYLNLPKVRELISQELPGKILRSILFRVLDFPPEMCEECEEPTATSLKQKMTSFRKPKPRPCEFWTFESWVY